MTEETKKIADAPIEIEEKTKIDEKESLKSSKCDNNLTISTKLSTDQLICKSPHNSPNLSIKSVSKQDVSMKERGKIKCTNLDLYLGVLQVLFGLLMTVFGVLCITHHAALSQIGAGIWGGCLAISSGTVGVLTSAKRCCPLKQKAHDIAKTVFLALSLISLAISQLVLVLAATGLFRDVEKIDTEINNNEEAAELKTENLASQRAILSNVGLIFASALQFICSAIACYKSARGVCPCFKSDQEQLQYDYPSNGKQAFVNSWLGKHNQPPFYVVAAPSTLGKGSKLSSGLPVTPIYTLQNPQMMQPSSIIGYPLIPAPLGPIPSPIIRPRPREYFYSPVKHPRDRLALTEKQLKRQRARSRSKSTERPLTTEDVAKTYTGLDRTIAEEFIDICESRNNSLCSSDSSCQSCCQCTSQNVCNLCSTSSSDGNSRELIIDKNKK